MPQNDSLRQPTPEDRSSYLFADGDSVGDRIELFLMDGDVEAAAQLSVQLQKALEAIINTLQRDFDGRIILAGGDDVLAAIPSERASVESCNILRGIYKAICGCTLSIGVGRYPERAVDALRRAKLLGRNQVIISEGA
jgi:hypothetical protein